MEDHWMRTPASPASSERVQTVAVGPVNPPDYARRRLVFLKNGIVSSPLRPSPISVDKTAIFP